MWGTPTSGFLETPGTPRKHPILPKGKVLSTCLHLQPQGVRIVHYTSTLSTRRAAQVAGVERSAILTAFQRNGHWRGVVPHRLPKGHLLWDTSAIFHACGKILTSPRPTPHNEFRDHVCKLTGTDVLQGDKFAAYLLWESAVGATPRERTDNTFCDLRDFRRQVAALAKRVGSMMRDEEHLTSEDWSRCNSEADQIEQAVSLVCNPLRWRIV